jgi:DNA-binding Lrp family transcriptional regulator
MSLKGQDILVSLKLAVCGGMIGPYAALAEELGMSASEVHAAVRRLEEARLLEAENKRIRGSLLRNLLAHGVPFIFAAKAGEVTRGIPTAWAAPAFAGLVVADNQLSPVWPDSASNMRGMAVQPLYPSVSHAAAKDEKLYALLASVDALRIGRARERAAAEKKIDEMLCG